MDQWLDAAAAADVTEGEVLGCVVDGVPVALFRLGDAVFALHVEIGGAAQDFGNFVLQHPD